MEIDKEHVCVNCGVQLFCSKARIICDSCWKGTANKGVKVTPDTKYKTREKRFTHNEIHLITLLIKNKIDFNLPNGDTVRVDQSENGLTVIRNEYGERVLRIFNFIEYDRVAVELIKLSE